MTEKEMVVFLADSLRAAAAEHGVPNSFAFSELVAPSSRAMLAGRVVHRHWNEFRALAEELLPVDVNVELSGGRLCLWCD